MYGVMGCAASSRSTIRHNKVIDDAIARVQEEGKKTEFTDFVTTSATSPTGSMQALEARRLQKDSPFYPIFSNEFAQTAYPAGNVVDGETWKQERGLRTPWEREMNIAYTRGGALGTSLETTFTRPCGEEVTIREEDQDVNGKPIFRIDGTPELVMERFGSQRPSVTPSGEPATFFSFGKVSRMFDELEPARRDSLKNEYRKVITTYARGK